MPNLCIYPDSYIWDRGISKKNLKRLLNFFVWTANFWNGSEFFSLKPQGIEEIFWGGGGFNTQQTLNMPLLTRVHITKWNPVRIKMDKNELIPLFNPDNTLQYTLETELQIKSNQASLNYLHYSTFQLQFLFPTWHINEKLVEIARMKSAFCASHFVASSRINSNTMLIISNRVGKKSKI